MTSRTMAKRPSKSRQQALRTNDREPAAKELPEPPTRHWLEQTFPETYRKPTPEELEVLNRFVARRGSAPRTKLNLDTSAQDETTVKFKLDYDDERIGAIILMDAVGTADRDFLQGLIFSLTEANTIDNQFDKHGFDSMLSVVKGLKPRDQVEAMLGAQMAAVHSASMRFAGRLASALNIPEMETAQRALTKLTRTFASQIETLKRYRSDGPNTVQNVSVGDGGQAVVANNITHLAKETARSEAVASGLGSAKANGREQ